MVPIIVEVTLVNAHAYEGIMPYRNQTESKELSESVYKLEDLKMVFGGI